MCSCILFYILFYYSELISKTLHEITDKLHFSFVYVYYTPLGNFTVWCVLVRTNQVFIEFYFLGPGFNFTFDSNINL